MTLTASIVGEPRELPPYVLDESPKKNHTDLLDLIFGQDNVKTNSVLKFLHDTIFNTEIPDTKKDPEPNKLLHVIY